MRVQPGQPVSKRSRSSIIERDASNIGDEGEIPSASTSLRKAGRYKLAAPVLKTGSAIRRGRSITDAFRHLPSGSSKAERPPDKRKTEERYFAGRPVTHTTSNERNIYENACPFPKPIAHPSQLQARPCLAALAWHHVSSDAIHRCAGDGALQCGAVRGGNSS